MNPIIYFPVCGRAHILLGYQGDNGYESVRLDVTKWAHGDPTYSMDAIFQRPDGAAYPVILSRETADVWIWRPMEYDTEHDGAGQLQLILRKDDVVAHSAIVETFTARSIAQSGTLPPDAPDWAIQILNAAQIILDMPYIDPVERTSGMSQPVGLDADTGRLYTSPTGGGGYIIGDGLKTEETEDGTVLSVDTVDDVEADNTRPITANAVYVTVGNINVLLETI